MKLRNFILLSSAVVALVFFSASYLILQQVFERSLRDNATENSHTLARTTFASMYELMSTGWTRGQVESFLHATEKAGSNGTHIQIYRGPLVEARYGQIQQPALDALATQTLTSQTVQQSEQGNLLRHVFPLNAEAKCLGCHNNAHSGDTLGLIEIRQDITPQLEKASAEMRLWLSGLTLIALLGAGWVVYLVNRRIESSVGLLESNIQQINAIDDLSHIEFTEQKAGFVEFRRIFKSLNELSQKLHDTAVDKDILKFEIRLLEKFVITSEVVKDWREYICQLLEEINKILVAHVMFSIFKIDDELFDLEIFWRAPPDPLTRQMMERHVREALRNDTRFGDLATVNIHHNFANHSGAPIILSETDVSLRVKSFFVEAPMIGGIVGIGVHADVPVDETRHLVMDSVLSTLLNVIGSVKAIYKYTSDLEYYATRDPLTNLYNQRVFWEMMGYEVVRAERHDYRFGLLLIDLDNFKTINDTHGHHIGDVYLQAFADCVAGALAKEDILARYGGDEFVIVLPESDLQRSSEVAMRVLHEVEKMTIQAPDGSPIRGTCSIGLAIYPDHAHDPKDLFLFADNLMYKAKDEGKDRVSIPSEDDVVEVFRDISQRSSLVLNAIDNKQITPYFQPILDVREHKFLAYECLSRIEVDGEVLRADQFVELAEKMGVIHRMDLVVIERALEMLKEHHFDGYIFFNLSPRSLVLNEFAHNVHRIVEASGIPPERIVFEITERDTVRNLQVLERFLHDLKSAGYRLALDDFGSGFSSFLYLRRFPIDFLKLDGDFIVNVVKDQRDRMFVEHMRNLAGDLGLKVIAEFVEDQEILDVLHDIGVDYAQGYHIGRPGPALKASADWQIPQ